MYRGSGNCCLVIDSLSDGAESAERRLYPLRSIEYSDPSTMSGACYLAETGHFSGKLCAGNEPIRFRTRRRVRPRVLISPNKGIDRSQARKRVRRVPEPWA